MGNPLGRTVAFWIGLFAVASARGAENLWWIDVRPLPQALAAVAGAGLLAHALWPRRGRAWVAALVVVLLAASLRSTVQYYALPLHARPPVPFTLFVALLLGLVLRSPRLARPRLAFVAASAALAVGLPLAQAWLYGHTDYRRPAAAIVVFGARCYADGEPSLALADRVRTGCALYHAGLAPRLVLSGGPGDGAVHETEAMRRLARACGVPAAAIELDPGGLSTADTVAHSGAGPVLAVSHSWHLPRVQLAYRSAGRVAYTVAARETRPLPHASRFMLREVAAFWWYWTRNL